MLNIILDIHFFIYLYSYLIHLTYFIYHNYCFDLIFALITQHAFYFTYYP